MISKQFNEQGNKSFQRTDANIDRSFPYRQWIKTQQLKGFFYDIDEVKFRFINGEIKPVAIIEITRCDSESAGQNYLNAIIQRYCVRDKQGESIGKVAKKLEVPMYLVLFQKDNKWFKVYSFRRKEWRSFTPQEYVKFLADL